MLRLARSDETPEDGEGRRSSERQRLTLRSAKVRTSTGEYACIIHDVSTTGAGLRFFHAPPPDTYLYLELPAGGLYAMERRWMDGCNAGYRFSAPVELAEFINAAAPQSSRPVRLRLTQPAVVRVKGEASGAMLVNLSQQGACIEAGRQIAQMQVLRLAIDGLPERIGHVCWRDEYAHGIVFQESLSLRELAEHAFRMQPYPEGAGDDTTANDVPPGAVSYG